MSERITERHRTVVETRIAYDARVSDLARRLYIALCGEGAWSRPIEVSTREWGQRLRAETESIRAALRQLAASGYVWRVTRPGARTQRVQAAGPVVGETTT